MDTLTRSTLTSDSNVPQTISNLTDTHFWSAGDNTAYDTTTIWTPPASGHLVKFTINIAALMNMSARSTNDATFTRLNVTLTEAGVGNVIWRQNYTTGFALQDATGEARMFIASETIANQSYEVSEGVPINIRVDTTFEQTATNTVQLGVCNFFPTSIDAVDKFWSPSGIVFYIDRERVQHDGN